MGVEYDNYGQIIIYTGLMKTDDGYIVPLQNREEEHGESRTDAAG